tara:strand:- start:300 stop:548 length:249 start_codon:yes stop_codon:yes gene_type:complete
MTKADLNKTLLEYANEDLGYAKECGSMMISETLSGSITINFEDELYQAFNSLGELLTGQMNNERMINWLIGQYDVSAVELED